MTRLTQRKVLIGITGGIAAYKSADLVRKLKERGAEVRVVMTAAAQEFITPLTLQALSGNPVHTHLLDPAAEAGMGHIELARWPDDILIAPASADFLARLRGGFADDLLTTLCLATNKPICVAPAMNQAMWANAATQDNLSILKARAVSIFGPAAGAQACGDIGLGRMLEPLELVDRLESRCVEPLLSGKRVVITAGPTREAIDPVRYLTNHSSGKMGYALAAAATRAGAEVYLISGPTALPPPECHSFISVQSATEMHKASLDTIGHCDVFIGSAAVADFRPDTIAGSKIKKTDSNSTMTLSLIKNPDIIRDVAASEPRPFCVGFAAETSDLLTYATDKLHRKNLDMVIANDVSGSDIGFNSDNNAVVIITREGHQSLPVASKAAIAQDIVTQIAVELGKIGKECAPV